MRTHYSGLLAAALVIAMAGCGGEARRETTAPRTSAPPASSEPSPTPTIQDVMELEGFAPLEPGTYVIDPDADPSTPLRAVYEVPVKGWSQWIGAVKFAGEGLAGVSITTVVNLVRHACRNHSPADPPVGPSVNDLATALADLAPFQLTSPPENVTFHGYGGKHLVLTVPDMAVDHKGFTDCKDLNLYSWIAPNLGPPGGNAFYGYPGPGYREEYWILDVEGTRLMIAVGRSTGSPPEDLAELQAILDSIRIEP